MKYDFTTIIDRHGKDALAVDYPPGKPKDGFDVIPMWVADMNFATAPSIPEAIIERTKHACYGYFIPRDEYFDAIINWQKERNGAEGLEREVYSYGTKLNRKEKTSAANEQGNITLSTYTSHTPEIKVRYPNHKLSEEGINFDNDARRMGQHLHKVFERANSIEEINSKIEQMAKQSLIADNEALRLKSAIEKSMTNEVVREWFTLDWDDVKSEADIITANSMRRPDRVMIKQGRAVVVDYKFGDNKDPKYCKQVAGYMNILSDMELYEHIEGYVWYISLGEIVKVDDMK